MQVGQAQLTPAERDRQFQVSTVANQATSLPPVPFTRNERLASRKGATGKLLTSDFPILAPSFCYPATPSHIHPPTCPD